MEVKIFISYRRKSWGFTYMLAKHLAGLIDGEVFIDVSGIDEVDFTNSILRHLRESSIVLVVVTEHTFNPDRIFEANDWVRQEIRMAIELAKNVILVLVDGLTPPRPELLPVDIQKVTQMQGIKFYPDYFSAAVESLVDFIQRITGKEIKLNSTSIQPKENQVPATVETLQEAVRLLDNSEYNKAIFLLESLQKAEFKSDFFDIEKVLDKALVKRDEITYQNKVYDEYTKIAILSQSAFTFDIGYSAWLAFCERYPDFNSDDYQLHSLFAVSEIQDESNLPKEITLTEILNDKLIDESHITSLWVYNSQPMNVDWLSVPIGILPNGNIPQMVFNGSNALITGSVASGKSELLQTLIIGLSIKYSPDVFQFILIDHVQSLPHLQELPHCQHYITNYSENSLSALLVSLKAELARRQQLLNNKSKPNIITYRRETEQENDEILAHLFIFIDESSSITMEHPSFLSELATIIRVGRSLGLSLILSSQRLRSTFSQELRAIMQLEIALRVGVSEDSFELIDRTDAEFLTTLIPGRGYIQIAGGIPKLIQIAKTKAIVAIINMIKKVFSNNSLSN